MSDGKIWAKVVEGEIMQTHDCHPGELWHPDMIEQNDLPGHWEEVPETVNIGWKFKNNEWISGGQWMEEYLEENPPAPPGPPTAAISIITQTETPGSSEFLFKATAIGIANETDWCHWVIDGEEYTTEEVTVTIDKIEARQTFTATLTVTGPGGDGTATETYEVRESAPAIPTVARN